ncbi:MAG: hypothetical protein OXO48_03655 [Caldilineaceae bacterium]|nr:hypothetical protein [Caldilineaceae bacterium]
MTSQKQPPESQYPLPGTPTDPTRIDFNVVGKEMANDLAVSALLDNLTNRADRNAVKEQLEKYLKCSDSIIDLGLATWLHIRPSEIAHKPTVKKYFEKHLNIILSGLK